MNNDAQNDKKFNPTVTAFFDSPKFAKNVFGKTDPDNAFLSMPLDDKAIEELQKAKKGQRLLLARSARPNKNGGATFFLEILPPYNKTATEQVEEL